MSIGEVESGPWDEKEEEKKRNETVAWEGMKMVRVQSERTCHCRCVSIFVVYIKSESGFEGICEM